MGKREGRRPAPGTILGVIAILIALGGSAYAFKLGKNSVKSKQIAPNAVKGVDAKESSFAQVPKAGQVDGHDAVCPDGTFLHAGTCFDSVPFAGSDFIFAAQNCADEGGYLPSVSELLSIRDEAGVDLGSNTTAVWSDSPSQEDATNYSYTVNDNGTLNRVAFAVARPSRCAFPLVR